MILLASACDICGIHPLERSKFWTEADLWQRRGYDPECDVLPTIRALTARERERDPGWKPKGLRYFTAKIAEANAERIAAQGLAGATTPPEGKTDLQWVYACQIDRETNGMGWVHSNGPRPGVPGCKVPSRILAAWRDGTLDRLRAELEAGR